jgi:predicted site-specific integrase-resolvase
MKKLNLNKLIRDLGGPVRVAEQMQICRTTPYRWLSVGRISVENLERLKSAFDFSLDLYFEDATHERSNDVVTARKIY